MSKITLDNLSDNLKAYLEGLGLTEEQVLNLINENGLDEEELKAMLKDTMSINELNTNSKTVIGAINELFQDVDNGKNLIATSIGNPLITGNSTFSAMSEAILGLRRESENETYAKDVLYNMMIEDGYNEANSGMTVDELIELLDRSGIDLSDIKQIACGAYHTIILKIDGSVWACGGNYSGQLGLGTSGSGTNKTTFTKVTKNINNDVKQIACSGGHTFILKNDGSVWACGYNDYGQLGLNDISNKSTFTKVTTNINNDVKYIACGGDHTFIIKNDGSLWSCGYNVNGQLGLGDTAQRATFTKVTTNINNDVKQIACGDSHVIILKNDGSIWACGKNGYGQLGLNDYATRNTFTQVTTNINNDVKQIACSYKHTFILKNDGSVWGCGYNKLGQLGLNDTAFDKSTFTQVTTNINNDVKQIACGDDFTFILKNDGSLWSTGYNNEGGLGLGDYTDKKTFTKVTTNINNDVKQITCGSDHAFIIKNDGSLWSCGSNDDGQLGLGDTIDKTTFTNTNFSTGLSEYDINRLTLYNYLLSNDIEVTESMDIGTMLDLLVDDYINNMILGYENNLKIILTDEGVSVNDEDNMDSLITKVDEEFDRQNNEMIGLESANRELENDIEETRNTLAGLMQEGGYDITGDESIDSLLDLLVLSGISVGDIKQIAGGGYHTFILKNDGSVWACGRNDYGQLGLNNTTTYKTFTQVTKNINNDVKQIACGETYTFIIKNDGSLWACGVNGNGQLGLGNTTTKKTFTQVTTNINNDVKQVACGWFHTFILKNDGSVWGCGYNSDGQLGLGTFDTNAYSTFIQVTTNINNDVKQIACGYYHTFILKNDNSVWSCGYNGEGQLGLGDATDRNIFTQVTTNINNDVKQIACSSHTFILKNDGSVWACGNNQYGGLGISNTTNKTTFTKVTTNINNDVKQIACGDAVTFILKNDGSVWSCGYNGSGQLGLGDDTQRTTFTKVTTNINNDVKQIACGGSSHTFILKNDDSIWSCGDNEYGQLGLSDTTQRNTFNTIPRGL